jgi:hypothetical protein
LCQDAASNSEHGHAILVVYDVTMSIPVTRTLCVNHQVDMEIKLYIFIKQESWEKKNSTTTQGGEEENYEKQRHPKLYTAAETGRLTYVVVLPWHVCCT